MNVINSEWKVYQGDTNYEVSNLGEVRRVGSKSYRKPRFNAGSYLRVNLTDQKTHAMHRMVAETFIEAVPGKEYVNHKNNVPWDNRVDNLEWCTTQENTEHSVLIGAHYRGEEVHTVKITEQQAIDIKYHDVRESSTIARELNVNKSTISKIRRGVTWKHI